MPCPIPSSMPRESPFHHKAAPPGRRQTVAPGRAAPRSWAGARGCSLALRWARVIIDENHAGILAESALWPNLVQIFRIPCAILENRGPIEEITRRRQTYDRLDVIE